MMLGHKTSVAAETPLCTTEIVNRFEALLENERYVLGMILGFMLINLSASFTFPNGYASGPMTRLMAVLGILWMLGFALRLARPNLPFVYFPEASCLMTVLGLQGAMATAAIAPFTGAYADATLAQADHFLMPFISWPEIVHWLSTHPTIFRTLNYIYVSENFQVPLLFLILSGFGRVREMKAIVAAGGIALIGALLIFTLMPAEGGYIHYGIARESVPDLLVAMPFEFPEILQHLKSGAVHELSMHEINGLISFPSFHAVTAVILIMNWSKFRYLAFPGILLNAMVIFTALPIGSHYICDLVAGSILGYASMKLATFLVNRNTVQIDTQARMVPTVVVPKRECSMA
ncbi:hypothetical protein GRI58_14730 [Porphyrobacter algicida]|uniref:Inositolphosphotransferase Aur1/Ipt1 domain-containing protein n=1 Tax=Qipengyuania algicida TaxID=1836209 RepID=A0A845AHF3_9SPHN|nr:phosphatase PAP2 family protein [Qipengyuania algicida]MXP30062.1 hypothetical protein [Qipengyuania algicida]